MWRCLIIKAKDFFHHYLWDLVLMGSVLLAAGGTALYFGLTAKEEALVASLYRTGTLMETIDLSKESGEREETLFTDAKSDVPFIIGIRHNAICVEESGCPNQYCVHQGWVTEANHPIVCAYYGVIILLAGSSEDDVAV
jgi:hypothetical protein